MEEVLEALLIAKERLAARSLWAEAAVVERLVYKSRSQHRRSSYFRLLTQVHCHLDILQKMRTELVVDEIVALLQPVERTPLSRDRSDKLRKVGNAAEARLMGAAHYQVQQQQQQQKRTGRLQLKWREGAATLIVCTCGDAQGWPGLPEVRPQPPEHQQQQQPQLLAGEASSPRASSLPPVEGDNRSAAAAAPPPEPPASPATRLAGLAEESGGRADSMSLPQTS
eukprot:jgi/Mesen1/727/ME000011S00072